MNSDRTIAVVPEATQKLRNWRIKKTNLGMAKMRIPLFTIRIEI
jgi:hypothetical protein